MCVLSYMDLILSFIVCNGESSLAGGGNGKCLLVVDYMTDVGCEATYADICSGLSQEPKSVRTHGFVSHKRKHSSIQRQCGERLITDQHTSSHPTITDDVGFSNAQIKALELMLLKTSKKENMLRDYCWLKTYCCQVNLMLLNDANIKLRLLEQSAAVDEKMKENTKYLLLLELLAPYSSLRDKDLQESKDLTSVCTCARFQVTPKVSHLHAVKRIFRYLKVKPHLGSWYPKDSPFNLVAYSNSDYVGASLDRKSTTGGYQFLGCRLISWQCKKQIVVATLSTKVEYVATASCCAQVLWIQNQLLDYGAQVCDLSSYTTKYSSSALTHKVFANIRRVGKGFSRIETPLFEGMIVAQQADYVADEGAAGVNADDVHAADVEPTPPSPLPTTTPPPLQKLPFTSKVILTPPPSPIAEPSSPPQQQQHSQPTHDAKISLDLLHTLLKTCTTLTRKVEALEKEKVAQALEIIKLKQRVKKLERKNKVKVSGLRTLKKVGTAQRVESSANTVMDDASKQGGKITDIDVDKDVTLEEVATKDAEIEENEDVQGRQAESQAQIYKIDLEHAEKVLSMQDDKPEPAELKEVQAQIEQDETYARELEAELNKNINWDDVIKQKYFNSNVAFLEKTKEQLEEEETRALKRTSKSLEEKASKKQKLDERATPLALKVPVIDYEIYTANKKPYYKIIRADGSHQLFLSFLSLLRNFDRRLGERRYPLTRFTLDQMLNNVRLEVEEESEVSLKLLKFVRQQQQEGYRLDFGVDAAEDFKEGKYAKGLLLLIEDLLLPSQVNVVD
nr:uncharacterized mitochondrial protein AtMg00810-like [Tanacetum cinerariifolium]